jgi:LmbE family N-acetylglucosaminyl deacetylase
MATIVAFHAHPDDEVLLTGGTIARLAAGGHRLVIVAACDGDMWTNPNQGRRLDELRASAAILGADKAVHLGYADSGHGPVLFEDPPGRTRFARADIEEAAGKLAALLTAERADLLLSYDPQGGNGHRDHVRVHQVGARAAELAGVRVVEATVPRELIAQVARSLLLLRLVTRYRLDGMRGYGTPRSAITHRVDVRRHAAQKRAALAAHRTQVSGRGRGARLLRALLKSPLPVFRTVCGTEWFAEPGGRTGELVASDWVTEVGRPERIRPPRQYLCVDDEQAIGRRAAAAIATPADFEDAFREHFAPVYLFIARRVGTALAEDLAAEAFATAYRRRTSLRRRLADVACCRCPAASPSPLRLPARHAMTAPQAAFTTVTSPFTCPPRPAATRGPCHP